MKIAIIGGGAIGLHVAAQLHLNGKQATVVCRGKRQAEKIERHGIHYIEWDQSERTVFAPARGAQDPPPETDWIFLTVKQPSLLSTIPYLKQFPSDVPLLCFQNGLGHIETLKSRLPGRRVYCAITTEGAYRIDERTARRAGKGDTYVGAFDHFEDVQPLEELVRHLKDTDLRFQIDPNIEKRVWEKAIINSCVNPLTALFGVKNGELIKNEYMLQAMELLFREAAELVRRRGIRVDDQFLQEIIRVCRNTYDNKSSMLQDIEAGRETEIEFINGAIARLAREEGMSASAHALVAKLVLAKSLDR